MFDDPWDALETPGGIDAFTARRVDGNAPWGFFWAVDIHRQRTLVLRHSSAPIAPEALPRLKDMEVFDLAAVGSSERMLGLRLTNENHREVFLQLCMDLVAWAVDGSSESEAVNRVLTRIWRWHHLLRLGVTERLSDEAQKGLIGELVALERYVMQALPLQPAVESWIGPLGGHRDFSFGGSAIECKARSTDHPFVEISSEFQLAFSAPERVFLSAVEVDRAATDGETVNSIATRLYQNLSATNPAAGDVFEQRITAAGFTWEQDYSDSHWRVGHGTVWEIVDPFPRISASELPDGISQVRYILALNSLEAFVVEPRQLQEAIRGGVR